MLQLWGKDETHLAVRAGVGVAAVVEAAAQDSVDDGAEVAVVIQKVLVCTSVTCP